MRENILWVEPYEFISIEKLEIEQAVNKHGKAYIKGIIHHTKTKEYLDSLQEKQWVKIFAQNEEETIVVLFCGLLVQAKLEDEISAAKLSLELISGTYKMDMDTPYRVFQNRQYSWKEVITELEKRYSDYAYYIDSDMGQVEGLRVQYQETDWQFLKRLLGEQNGIIVPKCYGKGIHFRIGTGRKSPVTIEGTEFSIISKEGSLEYIVESREIYDLGQKVNFHNKILYIGKIRTVYRHSECIHEYALVPKASLGIKKRLNHKVAGCSFYGVVAAVDKDKVQVNFIGNEITQESKLAGIQNWFLFSTVYSTPAGAGWYCMPEEGDRVRVYFPSDREEDAYAISAVHMEDAPGRQNPEYKSIKNKYGKEILMTPNRIKITNNKGMVIELDDDTGINLESNKDINIAAGGQIVVSSSQASVMMAGKESVSINQSGTSILVDKEILFHGSEFRIQ